MYVCICIYICVYVCFPGWQLAPRYVRYHEHVFPLPTRLSLPTGICLPLFRRGQTISPMRCLCLVSFSLGRQFAARHVRHHEHVFPLRPIRPNPQHQAQARAALRLCRVRSARRRAASHGCARPRAGQVPSYFKFVVVVVAYYIYLCIYVYI